MIFICIIVSLVVVSAEGGFLTHGSSGVSASFGYPFSGSVHGRLDYLDSGNNFASGGGDHSKSYASPVASSYDSGHRFASTAISSHSAIDTKSGTAHVGIYKGKFHGEHPAPTPFESVESYGGKSFNKQASPFSYGAVRYAHGTRGESHDTVASIYGSNTADAGIYGSHSVDIAPHRSRNSGSNSFGASSHRTGEGSYGKYSGSVGSHGSYSTDSHGTHSAGASSHRSHSSVDGSRGFNNVGVQSNGAGSSSHSISTGSNGSHKYGVGSYGSQGFGVSSYGTAGSAQPNFEYSINHGTSAKKHFNGHSNFGSSLFGKNAFAFKSIDFNSKDVHVDAAGLSDVSGGYAAASATSGGSWR